MWSYDDGSVQSMPDKLKRLISLFRKKKVDQVDAYFQFSTTLSTYYSFYEILMRRGIWPRDTPYEKEQFLRALENGLGGNRPQLICWENEQGKKLIAEIRMCLDEDYNPVDCGDLADKDNCGEYLVYNKY